MSRLMAGSRVQTIARHQVAIHQPLADVCGDELGHLNCGVAFADVVIPGEFRDMAVQMLRGHLVVGAPIAPFRHGPERLHPLRARAGFGLYIIPGAVVDGVMIEPRLVDVVGGGFIGVDRRAGLDVLGDDARNVRRVDGLNHPGPGLAAGRILRADDRRHVDWVAALRLPPLRP